jgi:hypothetical protein
MGRRRQVGRPGAQGGAEKNPGIHGTRRVWEATCSRRKVGAQQEEGRRPHAEEQQAGSHPQSGRGAHCKTQPQPTPGRPIRNAAGLRRPARGARWGHSRRGGRRPHAKAQRLPNQGPSIGEKRPHTASPCEHTERPSRSGRQDLIHSRKGCSRRGGRRGRRGEDKQQTAGASPTKSHAHQRLHARSRGGARLT